MVNDSGFRAELLRFAAVEALLAVVVTVVFARTVRPRWLAAVSTVMLAVIGFAAYTAVGMGG